MHLDIRSSKLNTSKILYADGSQWLRCLLSFRFVWGRWTCRGFTSSWHGRQWWRRRSRRCRLYLLAFAHLLTVLLLLAHFRSALDVQIINGPNNFISTIFTNIFQIHKLKKNPIKYPSRKSDVPSLWSKLTTIWPWRFETDLALERLFFVVFLQMLLRYSDGFNKVFESAAFVNFGGMKGSTMCLLTMWDTWFALVSSVSEDVLAAWTSGCWSQDTSDLLAAVPRQRK